MQACRRAAVERPVIRAGRMLLAAVALAWAAGCDAPAPPAAVSQASAGQVQPPASATVTRYAAARFLEQASFGPTEAEIDRVRSLGYAAWIDEQLALPPTQLDGRTARHYDELADPQARQREYWNFQRQWFGAALTGRDQLRQRVAYALSQIVVISLVNNQPYGLFEYHNMLQRQAFGAYGVLLRSVSVHPAMGYFLDNVSNRSAKYCIGCAANENYARELMQLFSIGLVRLNLDGTPVRDAQGRPIETYTQQDVSEMARALTGWEYDYGSTRETYAFLGNTMIGTQPLLHDDDAKTVLGTVFPAGRTAPQELDQAIGVLMAHPNTAPFVSLRLIQRFTASDPSPAYVARVATVFRNDGRGNTGNLAAVVKAILLDPEARRGDAGTGDAASFGKVREPVLHATGLLRGLGCRGLPYEPTSLQPWLPAMQQAYNAPSVFNFYAPTDRAPGSNLLAPEQALLNGLTFRAWISDLDHIQRNWVLSGVGCDLAPLVQAARRSPQEFIELVNQRWFRGALPGATRAALLAAWQNQTGPTLEERVTLVLSFALSSPAYGAAT